MAPCFRWTLSAVNFRSFVPLWLGEDQAIIGVSLPLPGVAAKAASGAVFSVCSG